MKSLQQKTHFPVKFDTFGHLQFETFLKANNSVDLPLSMIIQDGNKEALSNITASITYKKVKL